MKNPFLFFFRARDKPRDTINSAPTFYFGSSTAGKSVTAKSAIQLSTVYACVRVISETIASLPLHVYQADGHGSPKAMEHPLYRVFCTTNRTRKYLVRTAGDDAQPPAAVVQFLLQIVRRHVLGLYPLLPDQMQNRPRQ